MREKFKIGDLVYCYDLLDNKRIGIILKLCKREKNTWFDFYTVLLNNEKQEIIEFALDKVPSGTIL